MQGYGREMQPTPRFVQDIGEEEVVPLGAGMPTKRR
jgi:hypothetical protein